MLNEQRNNVIAGGGAISRTAANTFFPNWEHVHPLHERLIKKTEVSDSFRIYCRIPICTCLFQNSLLIILTGPSVSHVFCI